MSLSVTEILALVGRLDDAPGFDTPRERFRRFLVDRVTDAAAVRSLIEQSQRALTDQYHRALQDSVVLLGRLLGFETTFGIYQQAAGSVRNHGHWRSRHRLDVVIELRTEQTTKNDVEELSQALAALSSDGNVRQIALCIVTPLYVGRARLEDALGTDLALREVRIVSTGSLVWLAEMVGTERLTHDDVLRLLMSDIQLDSIVDLMRRLRNEAPPETSARTPAPVLTLPSHVVTLPPLAHHEANYWVSTIEGDRAATAEQFLESVVRERHVLGITDPGAAHLRARPDDWISFLIAGKGIVGHARLESVGDGKGLIRGSHRFKLVCGLKAIEIYDEPVMPAGSGEWDRSPFASVSRAEFLSLTNGAIEERAHLRHTGQVPA